MGTSVVGKLDTQQTAALPGLRDAMAGVGSQGATTAFNFFAAFDGTNNDRNHLALSGDPYPTNIGRLATEAESLQNDSFKARYYPGVGTGEDRGGTINAGVAPNAPIQATALNAYEDFRDAAVKYLKQNPGSTPEDISASVAGFSRGGATAIKFAQLVNERGLVDAAGNVLAPPGSIPITGMALLDPVGRFVDGDLSIPPNVQGQVLVVQAANENRSDFRPLDFSKDERVTTIEQAGNHVGIGGGYDQGGTAANVLEGVTGYFQNRGVAVADVPPEQRFDPTKEAKIYSEAYQTAANGDVLTNEDGSPRYAWKVDDPAQGRQLDSPQHPPAQTEEQLAANSAALLSSIASIAHWSQMSDVQRAASFSALYNTVDHMNNGELAGDLGGAASALSFVSALQHGNAGGVVVSGVSLANALGEDFASKEIASAIGFSGAAANVVPGLSLALAINSGNTMSIVAAAANFIPVYGPLISVGISLLGGMFGGHDDIPMREGLAHAQWDENGHTQIITDQNAHGGGSTANSWLSSLVSGLQANLDQTVDANGQPQYGLVPNLLPSVGFKYDPDGFSLANGARGFMYLQWTDEAGQTQTRYYDGAGERGDGSGETLAKDFMQHAQGAIAPAWQVQTVLAHYQQSGQVDLPAQHSSLPTELADGLHQTLQVVILALPNALPAEASASTQWIDVDGDGYAEQTQWVQANQAVLAVDLNGDGQIGLGETVNLQDASQVQHARTSMAWLDANGDGQLTAVSKPLHGQMSYESSAPTDTPNASAIFSTLSIEMLRTCRSTWAMKVRCKSASKAKSSCDHAKSPRKRTMLSANNSRTQTRRLGLETDLETWRGMTKSFKVSSVCGCLV
jgi:hypothetical protein